jgi:quinol-cytochrome oxidoreductase complex cytochrome b subunit
VAVLPGLLVAFLVAHVALVRRQGLMLPAWAKEGGPSVPYWPHQSFRNVVSSAAVIGVIVGVVLAQGGAHLDAPADPSSADYPARPEWYFLSLYQMLKYFHGKHEVISTAVIPSALLAILILLPLLDRVLPRRLAHLVACGFVFAVVGGVGFLTIQALRDDAGNVQFHEARKKADASRE